LLTRSFSAAAAVAGTALRIARLRMKRKKLEDDLKRDGRAKNGIDSFHEQEGI
jgi:hypothetical protein